MEFSTSTQVIILFLQTLGPFTVLITVYFLVTELREQNKVARANARQNIADSHQRLALAGLQKELVTIKVKLRNNEPLSNEEESMYITHFSAIVRARQNQFYQYSIGMLDEDEWNSMVSSLKTLFNDEKNIEVWDFMASTFPKDFVDFVDEKIKEREVYSKKKNS
jgi:hypothetical protein|tara:strand:+ start:92 stop:586 length:495 start_codon:yes stop_codon:yes gene_type:complete